MSGEMCCTSLLFLMSLAAGKPCGKPKTINATNKSLVKWKLFTCFSARVEGLMTCREKETIAKQEQEDEY